MIGNNLKDRGQATPGTEISPQESARWEKQLRPIEVNLQEEQVSPVRFDILCEKTPKTIFNIAAGIKNESTNQALKKAISELSPNQRKIIHLIFWEGLSEHEIANATKMPRTTITNRKYSAFRLLREKVGPNFPSYEETRNQVSSNPKSDIQSLIDRLYEQKINGRKI